MIFLVALAFTFSSCELVGDVLEVGVWLGIIIVIVVVALVFWIIRKVMR